MKQKEEKKELKILNNSYSFISFSSIFNTLTHFGVDLIANRSICNYDMLSEKLALNRHYY